MSIKGNKKSISAQTLEEMKQLQEAIKAESRNTIDSLLKEAVKQYIREAEEDEDETAVENDYEVVDNETENTDTENTEETPNDFESSEESEMPSNDEENAEEVSVEDETETEEGDDEWSEFSKYQVNDDNDTYDLTGEEDYDEIVKVYKLLKNDDNVVVKHDGDKISLQDNETGAEYVIDLCNDNECSEVKNEMNEDITGPTDPDFYPHFSSPEEAEDEIAGFEDMEEPMEDIEDVEMSAPRHHKYASDKELDDIMNDVEVDEFDLYNESKQFKNNKKSRKTMKENKEIVLEVDLGYTDNYQNEDPISGLSMTEPSKSGKSWEKGVPTGTEKPWAGETKSKGEPFEKTVNEEENPVDDVEANKNVEENGMFEGTNVTMPNRRKKSKSHSPAQKKNPEVAHHDSVEGTYNVSESIVKKAKAIQKENKELRNAVMELKNALKEAAMTNVNLGQFAKLIVETTTTKDEKVAILNRFNTEAKTIEQSKALYESIKKELNGKTQTLQVENSTKTINESKVNNNPVYKSQDLLNTIDLMKRMQNL